MPLVIFVTLLSARAEVLQVRALDYILKPFDRERSRCPPARRRRSTGRNRRSAVAFARLVKVCARINRAPIASSSVGGRRSPADGRDLLDRGRGPLRAPARGHDVHLLRERARSNDGSIREVSSQSPVALVNWSASGDAAVATAVYSVVLRTVHRLTLSGISRELQERLGGVSHRRRTWARNTLRHRA